MAMPGAVVAGAAAAILALTTTQHDQLTEERDAVVPPAPQECAVCLCELAGAEGRGEPEASAEAAAVVRTLPVCGHGFHAECIGRWLPLRAECPVCRRPVVTADAQTVAVAEAAAAAAAPAWSRPARMACGFGDGRVVWTRSPSPQEL